jgi:hypothetical protein
VARGRHTESVGLLRALARDFHGASHGDLVNPQGASEVDIEFPDVVLAARFASDMWERFEVESDFRDAASSLWGSVTLTVQVHDEAHRRIVMRLRDDGKTACRSGAVIAWTTDTRPDPTCLDATQTRTVTEAAVPLRDGGQARVSITHYSGRLPSRSSWVSVVLPGSWYWVGGCRSRYVRADVARRVAERAAAYVDGRWGADSNPRQF